MSARLRALLGPDVMDTPPEEAQRVLDNLTTAALVFDGALRLLFMNPAGEILLATSQRQARGQPLETLVPNARGFLRHVRTAQETGRPYTEREQRWELPGERRVTVDCTITPLAGLPQAVLIEVAQLDRQLRITREEHLISQLHATRALMRGLAHEIKNPLGGLRGAAQLLERMLADAELKEYTEVIIREADRLQDLVDRMLSPNAPPRRCATNIHRVLEHVRSLVQAEASGNVRVERDYDPSVPELWADPDLLIQAFLNIVRNAVQAVGERGEIWLRTRTRRQFTIGHRRHKLVLRTEVIDSGPGIAPEMIDHIFYPLVSGRAEGTGLGLSIAQSLIDQHGGLIECSSQPGRTRFTVWLPIESPTAAVLHG